MSEKKWIATGVAMALLLVAAVAASAQSSGCVLTVKMTKSSGTVWGSVMASYGGKVVRISKPVKQLSVPCGTQVTLTEKPTNPSNHSFQKWSAKGISLYRPRSASIQFTVNGSASVDAVYKNSAASPSSSSSGGGSWG